MIRDFIRVYKNTTLTKGELLRGLDIIVTKKHPSTPSDFGIYYSYSFKVGRWTDFFSFYVMDYFARGSELNHLVAALGSLLSLYRKVPRVEFAGEWYYFAPIAWWMLLWGKVRKMWMIPARFFYQRGMLKVDEGTIVPLMWFFRLRFRVRSQDGK